MANQEPEKLSGNSMDISAENRARLKQLFPSVFTETKNDKGELVESIDFEKLKAELGTFSDLFESRRERYGMDWPGKKDALRLIQTPSYATLKPCREESVDFDTTENLFIEGDNLEVLKLLQKSYYGKVKMIDIDPPYNTGKEFIYPDNFSESLETYLEYAGLVDGDGKKFSTNTANEGRFHTKWLNMMYPRLYLARNLLRDDGVIFIHIDDNEVSNLRKVCDEIFGEENFIGTLSIENNPKGRKNSDFIAVSSDYLHIYAKNKQKTAFVENIPKNANDMTEDEDGNFVHNSGKRVLVGENRFNNPVVNINSDKNYSVYYRREDKTLKILREGFGVQDQTLIDKGYTKYFSFNQGRLVENTYTSSKFQSLFDTNALEFTEDKIFEKNFNDTIRIKSQLTNKKYEAIIKGKKQLYSLELTTTGAGTLLKELFETDSLYFDAPKNIGLLKILITLNENIDAIVLDFFSGSGTTAHAVLDLNKQDNGNRKFILIQLPEPCDPESGAFKAGYKTIADIGKERIRRVIKKLNEEQEGKLDIDQSSKQDRGFKVLKLDKSNFKQWQQLPPTTPPDKIVEQMEMHIDHIDNKDKPEVLLYEILLKAGFTPTEKIETKTTAGKTVYSVADGGLLLCLEESVSKELIDAIVDLEPMQFICLDSAFHGNDQLKANAVQTFAARNMQKEKHNQIIFKTV